MMFRAALDALAQTLKQMIAHLSFELRTPVSDQEQRDHTEQHGSLDETLETFDEAVLNACEARNRFAKELNLDAHDLVVTYDDTDPGGI